MQKWITYLTTKGYSQVILVGHSEGALVANIACKHKNVIALISIAGAGLPAGSILKKQLNANRPKGQFEIAEKTTRGLHSGKRKKNSN